MLRDGQLIATRPARELDVDQVIGLMVGRPMENLFPERPKKQIGEPILEVEGLTRQGVFSGINLKLARGEIVGMAGLMGAGRTEVARALFGLDAYDSGTVRVKGREVRIRSVADAIRNSMVMLSEDRKRYGIIPMRDITENVTLSSLEKVIYRGYRHTRLERKRVSDVCAAIRVKTPSFQTPVRNLSGGNQQKVILARWMLKEPEILLLDEPTRGINVGTKFEIYKIMDELAGRGKAILFISSELPELLGVCDRIVVMSEGAVTGELMPGEFDQERIMKLATANVEKRLR